MGIGAERPKIRDTKGTILRIWSYLSRHRLQLSITAVLVVVGTVLQVLGPYLMGRAIDAFIIKGDMDGLARIVLLLGAVYAGSSLCTWIQARIMTRVAQETIYAIRTDLFRKMQSLPLKYFDTNPHGDTMSRMTNDVDTLSNVLTQSSTQIVSSVLTGIGVIGFMFWLQPVMAVVTITTMAGSSFLINRLFSTRIREGFRDQQRDLGVLNGIIEETITGQRVVKAYNQEQQKIVTFDAANRELLSSQTRAQTAASYIGPLMNFAVNNVTVAATAISGGWLAIHGLTRIGVIASFLGYNRQLAQPINQLAQLYNQIQSALAGAERFFEVMDEPAEIDAPVSDVRIGGDVVFDHVSFSYDGEHPVLKDVSLHAEPGQLVALVGPTGAGKTTIVNLLTRFYEIDRGEIRIDGTPLTAIPKTVLRQRLGIVLQDSFLFAGTVRENIRYGRLDATDDEIQAAAELSSADHFIRVLPDGYETTLTERGGNISHGQRQLIAIARALLADPEILILDEATSNVDTRTEKHIQDGMRTLMTGRTSFVIAHRLSTIRDADQILVINHGELVERGTHDELLAAEGFYARLHNSQFHEDAELARQEEAAQIAEQQLVANQSD